MNSFSTNQECPKLFHQALPLNTFEVQICLKKLILLFAKTYSDHMDHAYNWVHQHVFIVGHFQLPRFDFYIHQTTTLRKYRAVTLTPIHHLSFQDQKVDQLPNSYNSFCI